MPITLNGSGTITGLSAGGLPDLSVTTEEIAAGAITAPKLDGAQSGTAPIYGARAWVNFNGTGVIAIRASGNVSSLTDNGVGDYTVNFTTAMVDANYTAIGDIGAAANSRVVGLVATGATTAGSAQVLVSAVSTLAGFDYNVVQVSIFR
jgi:hypothetical protein